METVIITAGALIFINLFVLMLGAIALLEIGRRFLERVKSLLHERDSVREAKVVECQRMCVTLKNNEGEFIGLCIERSSKRWTFEQAVTVPEGPNQPGDPIDGTLHVPPDNILMFQEITEVHHAANA